MKIELHEITVGEICKGFSDRDEEGVVGYDGKLDIRPQYQREFVYDEDKRNAVIETIRRGFPLNVMYWAEAHDGKYELLDGQQRTISFARYVNGDYSVMIDGNPKYFHNLGEDLRQQILDYKLMIYLCSGTDTEKLEWFRVINIAGEKLTEQELRNAVYTGPWLSHAKSIFSKTNCAAALLSSKYVTGAAIRQEILETAIDWRSGGRIREYMSEHQHDPNANELWTYFKNVISWVQMTFTTYRKEMKGVAWGPLYDEFHDKLFDTDKLDAQVTSLMIDDDVTAKKGIYPFVLSGREKYLSIRNFSEAQRREAYERQEGICPACKKHFEIGQMDADHIKPWSEGGKTNSENCQMLCAEDNRRKGAK
jgi:hypothetical protein